MTYRAVIVFLRIPEKGRVKTRLSLEIDESLVLALYKGFVSDLLTALEPVGDTLIYFWPPGKEGMLKDWLGNGYKVYSQKGEDLGQKMSHAFQEVFKKGYDQAVLIGTDIPELGKKGIEKAFDMLCANDTVIGPAGDGGYYLIGFQSASFSTRVFTDIDWSSETVCKDTISAMKKESLQYQRLPVLNDIDTKKDLDALKDRVRNGGKVGTRTLKILKSI